MADDNHAETNKTSKRVAYIYNEELIQQCNGLPKVPDRASMVHSLITAYDLLPHMRVISPRIVKDEDIELFHSPGYVECLRNLSKEDDAEKYDDEAEMYGLTYDCPAYPGVFEYAALVAGASVTAAQALMMRLVDVAINWTGGWHHAKRDEASGFCYLNDIVIAILKLRQKYDRVLYVDIDLHHGDGVEDAFCATNKVMTVSFHKSSPGFFPGTGKMSQVGMARGKYFTVNVPLKDGIQDEQYYNVFTRVMNQVRMKFEADAIVCQCGADGLAHDPMVSYNLTPVALGQCIKYLMAWEKPMILLGGGGYNLANTARCWAYLTAVVLDKTLCDDIPEHKWFPRYGPDYDLSVQPGNRSDQNTVEYLDKVVETITENLSYIGS